MICIRVYRWGKSPLDEARVGGNKNLIKLLEDAKGSQLSEFSPSFSRSQGNITTEIFSLLLIDGKPSREGGEVG